jgi:tetratricopeptide (TPR) repeat protein
MVFYLNCHFYKNALRYFWVSLTIFIYLFHNPTFAGTAEGNSNSGRVIIIRITDDTSAAFTTNDGWIELPGGACVLSPFKTKFCAEITAAKEITVCQFVEAQSRFKDAPGDPDVIVNYTNEYSGAFPTRGIKESCSARIVSPRDRSIYFRAAYLVGSNLISIVSDPFIWNVNINKENMENIEKVIPSFFGSLAFSGSKEFAKLVPSVFPQSGRPNFEAIKSSAPQYSPRPRNDKLIAADKLKLTGKIDSAENSYASLAASFPYDSEIGLGDIAMARRENDSAIMHYEKALSIDDSLPDAYNGLGSIKLAQNDYAGAESYFNKAQDKNSGNPSAFVNIGWLELDLGRYIEAERNFMEALARAPDLDTAAAATNGLTEIAFHYGEPSVAVAWNKEFISKLPDYPEAYANLARAYLDIGQNDRAIESAEILLKLAPDVPYAKILAGRVYFASGKFQEAANNSCRFISNPVIVISDKLLCAQALEKSGDTEKAVSVLKSIADSSDSTPEVFLNLGALLEEKGDRPAAMEIYKRGIERFPRNEELKKVSGFNEKQ